MTEEDAHASGRAPSVSARPPLDGPTLGSELRGARFGYRWADELGGYLRLERHELGWLFDLCPPDVLPSAPDRRRPSFLCWWELDDLEVVMETARRAIAGSALPVRVKRRILFVADDDGELVDGPIR